MKWVSKGRCLRRLKGTTDFSISARASARLVPRTMIPHPWIYSDRILYVMFTHCMGLSSQIFLVSKRQAGRRGVGEGGRAKFTRVSSGQAVPKAGGTSQLK